MINKRIADYFNSTVFRFVGAGGMMGASYFDGQPEQYTPPDDYAPPINSYTSAVFDSQPVAYWRLNEASGSTLVDEIGGTFNGVYNGGVTHVSGIVAGTSGAVNFNGTNAFASVTSRPSTAANFTLETWAYCSASSLESGFVSERFTGSGNPIQYEIGIGISDGGASGRSPVHFGHYTSATWLKASSGAPFPIGETSHVVGTASGLDYRVYINAVEQGQGTAGASALPTADNGVVIGRRHDTTGTHPYLDGTMSDVAIYDRALTLDDIRQHYALGQGYDAYRYPYRVVTDGAGYYWQLASAIGSTVRTLVNVPTYAGELHGGVTLGNVAPVLDGQASATNFDDSNDRLTLPSLPETLTSATFEIAVQASTQTANHRFASFNGQAPFVLCRYITASTLAFGVNASTSAVVAYASNIGKVAPQHYVGTYKQNGEQRIYLNGDLQQTVSAPGAFNQVGSDQVNSIGSDRTFTNFFDGDIGDIAIYPTQISASAVAEHNALARGFDVNSYAYEVCKDKPTIFLRMKDADAAGGTTTWSETGKLYGVYRGSRTAVSALVSSPNPAASTPACYISGGQTNKSGVDMLNTDLFELTGSHTLEFWVRLFGGNAYNEIMLIKHTNNLRWPEYAVFVSTTGQITQVCASAESSNGQNGLSTVEGFHDSEVHHIITQHDNPNNARHIWVDGMLHASKSWAANIWNGISRVTLMYGDSAATTHNAMDGEMDSFAAYASVLPAAQIRRHYAFGKGYVEGSYPFRIIEDGPTKFYRLANVSASTQRSDVGNTYYLTPTNASKINPQASALIPSADYAAYFSATSAASTANPVLYITSATFDAVPIQTLETWFTIEDQSQARHPAGLYTGASNRMHFRIPTDTGALDLFSGAASSSIVRSPVSIINDKVYHAVATYDGTDTTLYLNGVQQDVSTVNPGGMDDAAQLVIGGLHNGTNRVGSWVGRIGDVALYDEALTADQVLDHYERGTAGTYMRAVLDSDPLAYWQLGQDNVNSYHDLVTSSTTLSLVRASANVSTLASSMVTNNLGDKGMKFDQTGGASLSQALYQSPAIASAGAPLRSFETWFRIANGTASRHLICTYISDVNRMLFRVHPSFYVGVYDGVSEVVQSAASSVNPGEDHYAAVTYDGTNTRLYLDGELVDMAAGDPGGVGGARIYVGGYNGAAGKFGSMSGHMDDVAVYTSVLSPQTIREHYLKGTA